VTGWISFTTDYGSSDGFVAACHGVIAGIAPDARVLDVTHQIPAGNVRRGAVVLSQTLPYLPPSVHVAVVDPGVGTTRRAVAVDTAHGVLVGPDNGLLVWAAEAVGGARSAVVLDNSDWHLRRVRRTFHGRDIFAPVAAHLVAGRPLAEAGTPLDPAELVELPAPVLRTGRGFVEVEVLTVDTFGNVQLAAGAELAAELHGDGTLLVTMTAGATGIPVRLGETFGAVEPGELVAYLDSADQLTLAVNRGNASERLALGPGDLIRLSPS
jgi:S-adenosylmethionine hydrolase